MERLDALRKASEIAQAMVRINNVLMDNTMATYQPERDRVSFYLYGTDDGASVEHFRFEATRHEYVIHDVLAGADRWRGNVPERALSTWAGHLLDYVNLY